jgi:hypothetical protein
MNVNARLARQVVEQLVSPPQRNSFVVSLPLARC